MTTMVNELFPGSGSLYYVPGGAWLVKVKVFWQQDVDKQGSQISLHLLAVSIVKF